MATEKRRTAKPAVRATCCTMKTGSRTGLRRYKTEEDKEGGNYGDRKEGAGHLHAHNGEGK